MATIASTPCRPPVKLPPKAAVLLFPLSTAGTAASLLVGR